jgi:hypothetical protein
MVLGQAALVEAATVEIAYSSIEKMIVRQLMTEGGRYYMQGDPSTPCKYAFVQDPRVDAVGERLRITLLFSGKAAVNVGGQCRGAGDNFDLYITGVPTYSAGEIFLAGLEVESSGSSYFKVVAPLIRSSLEKNLRVPLREGLERAGAHTAGRGIGTLTFENLSVDQITVGENAVKVSADFAVALRP